MEEQLAKLKPFKKSGLQAKRSGCAVDVAYQLRGERFENVHSSEREGQSRSRNETEQLPQSEHNGVVRETGVVINVPWFFTHELVLHIKAKRSVTCSSPYFVHLKGSSKVDTRHEQGLGCPSSAVLGSTCHSP